METFLLATSKCKVWLRNRPNSQASKELMSTKSEIRCAGKAPGLRSRWGRGPPGIALRSPSYTYRQKHVWPILHTIRAHPTQTGKTAERLSSTKSASFSEGRHLGFEAGRGEDPPGERARQVLHRLFHSRLLKRTTESSTRSID